MMEARRGGFRGVSLKSGHLCKESSAKASRRASCNRLVAVSPRRGRLRTGFLNFRQTLQGLEDLEGFTGLFKIMLSGTSGTAFSHIEDRSDP